jgi:prepilin-type N-terminal cleavage/methylation domain-containing protein
MKKIIQRFKSNYGFTMIELLIVMTILAILAVAVISVINPIELINRAKDNAKMQDAEQLISAVDRFYAANGYYPWMAESSSCAGGECGIDFGAVQTASDGVTGNDCPILYKLGSGVSTDSLDCPGTNEVKQVFMQKLLNDTSETALKIYNGGSRSSSTYVCFTPMSTQIYEKAVTRCNSGTLPADFPENDACDGGGEDPADGDEHYCLPTNDAE